MSDDLQFVETMRDMSVPVGKAIRSAARWLVAVATTLAATAARWSRSAAAWHEERQARADDEGVAVQGEPAEVPRRRSWLKIAVVSIVLLMAAALITPVAAIYSLPAVARAGGPVGWGVAQVLDVPDVDHDLTLAERSVVYAADGSSLGMLVGEQNRVLISLTEIPDHLVHAVIATEDAGFYEHEGVDPTGILRAAITNLRSGTVEQGASTITQQYVKNALLTSERSFDRKLTEAITAVRLEEELSKDEILERYLNLAYFGNGNYGVAAASEYYYGVPVQEISLAQAARLAGTIRSPEANNPVDDLTASTARRDLVLAQMRRLGLIDQAQYDEAIAQAWTKEQVSPPPAPRYAFFNEYIKAQLLNEEALGADRKERAQALFGGGLRIHTTLVPSLQDTAQATIDEHLKDPAADPLAGLISLDPRTGAVLSMAVGPKKFGVCDGQECLTTKVNPLVPNQGGSGRQPGSSFKPIIAAAALEAGLPSNWSASAEPREIEDCGAPGVPWEPHNYSDSADRRGTIDLLEGMRTSNNVYFAQLIAEVGPDKAAEMANRLGISTEVPPFCSIVLGTPDVFPIDMARVFGTFANGGVSCAPLAVTRVENAIGDVLFEREPSCERVIEEDVAAKMNTLLKSVVDGGTGTAAQLGRDVAGKTGTTDDYRDAWFVGYVPQMVTASWLGFEQPRPMENILGLARISGGSLPTVLWASYMSQALQNVEPEPLLLGDIDRYVAPPPPPQPKEDKPPKESEAEVEATEEPEPEPTEAPTPQPPPSEDDV